MPEKISAAKGPPEGHQNNVAQNPIICSTDLQSCRSCRPKPPQHAEGYYTEFTMATGRKKIVALGPSEDQNGPRPKTEFGHTLEGRREPFYVEN